MDGRKRTRILDVPIDMVSGSEAMERFISLMKSDKPGLIVTPNSEIVLNASKDPELKRIIEEADLIIPDGIGLVYASKILSKPLKERVTGIDFLSRVLAYLNEIGGAVFLLGGKPEVAGQASEKIKAEYPGLSVAGVHHGYFNASEETGIVEEINKSGAGFLCVAMGSPKQEQFIHKHKSAFTRVRAAMGVGGSLDVWAGTLKRAPEFYQKHGLEWLYRLIQEPSRYKRMLKLPVFMIKVIMSKKKITD